MNEQASQKQQFTVSVYGSEQAGGSLVFTFVPKGFQQENGAGGAPQRILQYVVAVRQESRGPTFDWSGTPDDPGAAREEIQTEIAARMKHRSIWLDRLASLVGQVEQWAREMGWSTRRVEKNSMTPDRQAPGAGAADAGRHLPDSARTDRAICAGAEGVVDLYLMPAYDDIASLYYYGNRWNLHYTIPWDQAGGPVRESEALPLSKETLAKVLAELRQNAV